MTRPTLTFTNAAINGGTAVRVLARACNVGFSSNLVAEANENNTEVTEVQTQGFENLVYTISGVRFTGESNTLTYAMLLTLAKLKYDGTNAILLACNYGTSDQLVASDGTTTSIPVVVKTFNFTIDVTESKDGKRPIANITLMETA